MILVLTRGDSPIRIPLHFPISPAEEREVFAKLDTISTDVHSTRIVEVHSAIPNLGKYLKSANIVGGDYGKIKHLNMQLDNMTEQEQCVFSGALDTESINSMDDILRIAEHLNDYELIEDVTTDRELGEWLVENNMMAVEFPQVVRPYLDYVAIGAEYYSNHGGAYTLNGYVKHREADQKLTAELNSVFTLHLASCGRAKMADLHLPATEENMKATKRKLQIDDVCNAEIIEMECTVPFLDELLPVDGLNIEDANELALTVEEMQKTDGELLKFCSVLKVEQPQTFQGTVNLALNIDDYERVPTDPNEYGFMILSKAIGDMDIMYSIDGYMDFERFGEDCMREDGVYNTQFGAVRRLREPFLAQQQEQTFQ